MINPSISNLGFLEILHLDENALTTLPDEICELSSLEVLSLSKNALFYVPPGVFRLRKL
jgi:Leucine-rich repeat (LRR) protein